MLELTGLDVRATVRAKIPAKTKLIARRIATVSRAGEVGFGRNATAASKYWALRSSTLLPQVKFSRDLVAR